MIQRVQSLFLAVAVICLVASMFFPVWQKIEPENNTGVVLRAFYTEMHTRNQTVQQEYIPTAVLSLLVIVGLVVALFEIFAYNNRIKQMKLGALNSLILAGFLGLSVYFTFRMEKMVSVAGEGSYEFGMYLPAVALILNLLANRFIRKDEALVRSVDRIR